MRTLLLATVCLCASLLGTTTAKAWASSIPELSKAEKKQDFEGVKGLTHYRCRVYGMWVNMANYYYYQGDRRDFQSFLDRLSALEGFAGKELRLVDGMGQVSKLGQKDQINFDWALGVTPNFGDLKARQRPGRVLRVTLYLGGKIKLAQLKLPKGIQVVDTQKDA